MDSKELQKMIGLDPETIQERVIEIASEKIAKGLGQAIEKDIRKSACQQIDKRISDTITDIVKETVQEKYVLIDFYGELCGEETTIRAHLKKTCLNWWNAKVDPHSGEESKGFYSIPRQEYIAKKLLTEVVQKELQTQLATIVSTTRSQIEEGMIAVIKQAIASSWKNSS